MVEATVKNTEEKATFPCLMTTAYGKVVLMESADSYFGIGTVIVSDCHDQPVGYFSDCWAINDFKPFNGEVTLKNK